ncbi:PREDICTED: uncharacterized protein LOC101364797 [Odobenus rosmarus divergens]|uniref:Uncharacterized protein LOC101364797 n=1 Tax=Odobenus rosmarus divergens TaxID=9708 RepID=A0A2U3W2L3_ODORO
MTFVFILTLGVLLFLRTGAQSVTQPDAHVTVPEESPLELRCNYSSLRPYLYWYVQYPNQGLQLLLQYVSGNTKVQGIKGFKAELKDRETSFHLKKPSAHWSDSAVYFCAIPPNSKSMSTATQLTSFSDSQIQFQRQMLRYVNKPFSLSLNGVTGAVVELRPPALSLQEGSSSTLQCNFSTSTTNVHWYRQDPGGRLIHLFYIPSGTKQNGRLNSTTVAKERRSSLYISSSQTTDSATYFCAVDPQCSPGARSLCTNPQLGWAPPPAAFRSGARRTASVQLYHSLPYLQSWNQMLVCPTDLGLWSSSSLLNLVSLFLYYKPLAWNTQSS